MSDTTGGRHSSDSHIAFYRSALLWFLPWIVVGVVALGAIWIAIDALGNDAPASSNNSPRKDKGAAIAPSPEDEQSEEPLEEPEDESTGASKKGKKKREKPELKADGASLQVLNGTRDESIDDEWADKLEGLGFEVVAVNPYGEMKKTTVYWSTVEAEDAAQALADKFGWGVEPKPEELSSEVDVHVYLGEDEL